MSEHSNQENFRGEPNLPGNVNYDLLSQEAFNVFLAQMDRSNTASVLVNRLPYTANCPVTEWQVDFIIWETYLETGAFTYKKFMDFASAYWWARMVRHFCKHSTILYGDVASLDLEKYRRVLKDTGAIGPSVLQAAYKAYYQRKGLDGEIEWTKGVLK